MSDQLEYRLDQRDGQIYTYSEWRDISYGLDQALVNVNDMWDQMSPIEFDIDKRQELQEKMYHIYQQPSPEWASIGELMKEQENILIWGKKPE